MRFFAVSFLFVAGIVNYLDRVSFSIANTSIRADLGLSGTQIGALLSAFSLAYGVAQLPIGLMLDRLGSRAILAAGMFVWSLAQMATGLVSSFAGFMTTRISLGAGEAPMMPCGVKVMNDWFGVRDRGLPTGLLTASNTLGVTLAPPVLTVIMLAFGWRAMFVSVGLFSLLLSLAWYPLYRDRASVVLTPSEADPWASKRTATERNVAASMEAAVSLAYRVGHDAGIRRSQLHHLALPVVAAWLSAGGTAPDHRQDRLGGDHSLHVRHHRLGGEWRRRESIDPPRLRSHDCLQDSDCWRNVLLRAQHPRGGLRATATGAVACVSTAIFFIYFAGNAGWGLAQAMAPTHMVASVGAIQNFGSFVCASLAPLITGWLLDHTHSFNIALMICALATTLGALSYWFIVRRIDTRSNPAG